MAIKKRKGFDIGLMLAKLSEDRTLNPDVTISPKGLDTWDKCESFLRTAVVENGKSNAFVGSVVREAMSAEQDLNEQKFIEHCNRIASIKEQTARQPYKVVFPVWESTGLIRGQKRWNDVSIMFGASPVSNFLRRAKHERAEQLKRQEDCFPINMQGINDLPLAVCSVQAIDAYDAFELAESAISIELGLYSIFLNRGKFILTNDPSRPISTVLLAPHMTVHDLSGGMSSDIFWYNEWPKRMVIKDLPKATAIKIHANVEKARKKIRRLPWRSMAEKALVRHHAAFSQSDLEASFLDGWRLLEAIGGHPFEKGETLVKRAAWFFENRDEMFQIGIHLMHRRNLISHGRPIQANDKEGLAFQMKEFLTPFLRTILTNPFSFKDIEELWKFCDLPTNKEMRKRQMYLLKCGVEFRQEK
ncbi:MAG: hypothetical protein L3J33_07130 [Rhodobacteraceae bacterium]|nr:hypothetical protein [Paracoccaceae bacterium]